MREAISEARRSPIIETLSAANFKIGGIDMTGVLKGRTLEVINSPAMMLPHANRLMGLMTAGLFSLMGERELNRGYPMETKKMTRRL